LLRQAVFNLKQPADPNLLVGFNHADDAGVYRLEGAPHLALVQTVDFFTPIVDDPLWYGRIAAANSLSDVYAMGGKPLTAMNILCYPEELGPEVMSQILKGGLEKMKEAGCTLVGGHSVADPELKYGLSVTGLINPSRIFSNEKAKPGQALVLTKKIGTGIVTTAGKARKCPPSLLEETINQMARLNDRAAEAALKTNASTCTDITGFGFLGHLSEVVKASRISARIDSSRVPFLPGVHDLVRKGFLTKGDRTNREYCGDHVHFGDKVDRVTQSLLFDPQTSGGLLIALPQEDVARLAVEHWVIGETLPFDPKQIQVF
jgi:selenide,water dikinase